MKVSALPLLALTSLVLTTSPGALAYTSMALPGSVFSLLSEPKGGLSGQGEAGISLIHGNTRSEQLALAAEASYRWDIETAVIRARYLEAAANDVQNAQNWILGSRYERRLAPAWGGFVGQSIEADRFAGLFQRYATDLGVRHRLWRDEKFAGAAEAGYRFQFENRLDGPLSSQIPRMFLEMAYQWSGNTTLLWGNEFLPDLGRTTNWRLNSELDLNVGINGVFTLSASYGMRYDHLPANETLEKLERTLLTSLKAKF